MLLPFHQPRHDELQSHTHNGEQRLYNNPPKKDKLKLLGADLAVLRPDLGPDRHLRSTSGERLVGKQAQADGQRHTHAESNRQQHFTCESR